MKRRIRKSGRITDHLIYLIILVSALTPVILGSGIRTKAMRKDMFAKARVLLERVLEENNQNTHAAFLLESVNKASYKAGSEYLSIADRITIDKLQNLISFSKPETSERAVPASGKNVAGRDLKLHGKLVIIDPGHGGYDPGSNSGTLLEKDLTMDMSLRLKKSIEENGGEVLMTRVDDSFHSLLNRSAIINKHILELERKRLKEKMNSLEVSSLSGKDDIAAVENYNMLIGDISYKIALLEEYTSNPEKGRRQGIFAYSGGMKASEELREIFEITSERYHKDIIFISMHINVFDTGSKDQSVVSGVQVYIRDNESKSYGVNSNYFKNYNKEERERLASSILTEINKKSSFSQKWRDVYEGDLSVLRENNLVSVLIEAGFINNPNDRKVLNNEAERQKISDAIASGIINYFTNPNEKPHQ